MNTVIDCSKVKKVQVILGLVDKHLNFQLSPKPSSLLFNLNIKIKIYEYQCYVCVIPICNYVTLLCNKNSYILAKVRISTEIMKKQKVKKVSVLREKISLKNKT